MHYGGNAVLFCDLFSVLDTKLLSTSSAIVLCLFVAGLRKTTELIFTKFGGNWKFGARAKEETTRFWIEECFFEIILPLRYL